MRKPSSLAYLSCFVCLLGCGAPQEEPDPSAFAWEHVRSTDSLALATLHPPPLSSHVMVYHHGVGMVVMFGGSDPNREPSNTLWGWNGSYWQILSTDGPAPRLHTGMAYDDKRNRLVIYGGIKNREEIERWMETLKENERRVIKLRFGLNGDVPHTLEEIGKMFGFTRERVRQIEHAAINKLRALIQKKTIKAEEML